MLIPGEFHGEAVYRARPYGSMLPALNHAGQGQHVPREAGSRKRPVTISVWAPPNLDALHDELDQVEITELLEEAVRCAVQATLASDVVWGDVERAAPPQERNFGEAILLHIMTRGPQFYPASPPVFPQPSVARSPAS